MAYIDESLSAGEEISSLFKQHWIVRLPMVLWLLLSPLFFPQFLAGLLMQKNRIV